MPSVAQFIRELLSEDKYDAGFSERIEERIQHLNAAQLQGMYNHLVTTMKNSKSDMWAQANKDIISKIEGLLVIRTAEAAKEKKKLEEIQLKQQHKKQLEKEAKKEKKRVMRMIADTALKSAETAVREEENKRQADEKVEIMRKVFVGEEKRNSWWKRTAAGVVVCVVVVCVVVKDIYILIGCLLFICLVAAVLTYKAYHFTTVLPAPVDEGRLAADIKLRQDVLKKKAISVLREKEQRYQEQVYRDRMEKKKRIEIKKNREKFELQLMESRRLEQIAMAKEALSKRKAAQGGAAGDSLEDKSVDKPKDSQLGVVQQMAESKGDSGEERGPETDSVDLNLSDLEEERGPHLLVFSELDDEDEDADADDSADDQELIYRGNGGISGDNSNIVKLSGGLFGQSGRNLFSDTNNGEEFSEYRSRPCSDRGDIESNLSTTDDEEEETRARAKNRHGTSNRRSNNQDSECNRSGIASADHSGLLSGKAVSAHPQSLDVELFAAAATNESTLEHSLLSSDDLSARGLVMAVEDLV